MGKQEIGVKKAKEYWKFRESEGLTSTSTSNKWRPRARLESRGRRCRRMSSKRLKLNLLEWKKWHHTCVTMSRVDSFGDIITVWTFEIVTLRIRIERSQNWLPMALIWRSPVCPISIGGYEKCLIRRMNDPMIRMDRVIDIGPSASESQLQKMFFFGLRISAAEYVSPFFMNYCLVMWFDVVYVCFLMKIETWFWIRKLIFY